MMGRTTSTSPRVNRCCALKTYHGKPGKGAGVEFNIKEGPITMLSIGVRQTVR